MKGGKKVLFFCLFVCFFVNTAKQKTTDKPAMFKLDYRETKLSGPAPVESQNKQKKFWHNHKRQRTKLIRSLVL